MSPFTEQCDWMDDTADIHAKPTGSMLLAIKGRVSKMLIDFKTFYDVTAPNAIEQFDWLGGLISALRTVAGLLFIVSVYDILAINGLVPDLEPLLQLVVLALELIGEATLYTART